MRSDVGNIETKYNVLKVKTAVGNVTFTIFMFSVIKWRIAVTFNSFAKWRRSKRMYNIHTYAHT